MKPCPGIWIFDDHMNATCDLPLSHTGEHRAYIQDAAILSWWDKPESIVTA